MPHHVFTRQALYDRVWAEPMRTVAHSLGVSDVGLAKACRAADIPTPPRGWWAKLQHNKPLPPKPPLPARPQAQAERRRQAETIRAYVLAADDSPAAGAEDYSAWRDWALAEADALDPLKDGSAPFDRLPPIEDWPWRGR